MSDPLFSFAEHNGRFVYRPNGKYHLPRGDGRARCRVNILVLDPHDSSERLSRLLRDIPGDVCKRCLALATSDDVAPDRNPE